MCLLLRGMTVFILDCIKTTAPFPMSEVKFDFLYAIDLIYKTSFLY